MANFDTLRISLDTRLLSAAVQATAKMIAIELRSLPRMTEDDGSKWVDAEILNDLAAKLESL